MRKCWRNFFSNCILAKCKLGLWWIREESGFCIFAWNTQWNTQCAALLFNLNIPFCCIIEKDYPEKYSQKLWDVHIFHVWGTKFVEMFFFLWNRNIVFPPFLKVISKSQNNKVAFATLSEWNQCFIGTIPIDATLLTEVDNQRCGILNRQAELDRQTNCFAVLLENSGKSHNRSHSSEVSRRTLSVLKVSFPYN